MIKSDAYVKLDKDYRLGKKQDAHLRQRIHVESFICHAVYLLA